MQVNTEQLTQDFSRLYPGTKPAHLVRAPGRVNLIGEHVDYNQGYVLPIAMSQALWVLAGPADDGQIAVHTTAYNQSVSFPADDPGQPGPTSWTNYMRGVAAMLLREGVSLRPGRLLIHSDVPVGGGVSSSAALEVGTALALLALAGHPPLEPVKLALLARRAEHEYAKSPCGIMDQFICVLGKKDHALLLDCRSQTYQQIPMPFHDCALMVMNTQVKHEVGGGEYAKRQAHCAEGLAVLRKLYPQADSLRDVSFEQLEPVKAQMQDTTFRRCRHVVTEIARTVQAGDALRRGDAALFGKLMSQSHTSLRDDYEVSCEELNAVVEIASATPGCYGARMTGAGFGGCAIALIERSAEPALRDALHRSYDGRFAQPVLVYATHPDDGAAVRKLV